MIFIKLWITFKFLFTVALFIATFVGLSLGASYLWIKYTERAKVIDWRRVLTWSGFFAHNDLSDRALLLCAHVAFGMALSVLTVLPAAAYLKWLFT